jgi:hypothetical protein
VKPGKTPILQPIPPPGTPTSRPTGPAAGPAGEQPLDGLAPTGGNSAAQAREEAAKLDDPQLKAAFEQAFVLVFNQDRTQRNDDAARRLLQPLLERNFAPAWRVQGYTYIDQGMQMGPAMECYRKAIAADETYGPAHYALAFVLSQVDPVEGKQHYKRAMELGVEDERKLGEKFYPD